MATDLSALTAALTAGRDLAPDEAAAAVSLKLSDEDVAELESPYVPHAVAGFR